jgi:hypothetical protein
LLILVLIDDFFSRCIALWSHLLVPYSAEWHFNLKGISTDTVDDDMFIVPIERHFQADSAFQAHGLLFEDHGLKFQDHPEASDFYVAFYSTIAGSRADCAREAFLF